MIKSFKCLETKLPTSENVVFFLQINKIQTQFYILLQFPNKNNQIQMDKLRKTRGPCRDKTITDIIDKQYGMHCPWQWYRHLSWNLIKILSGTSNIMQSMNQSAYKCCSAILFPQHVPDKHITAEEVEFIRIKPSQVTESMDALNDGINARARCRIPKSL